MADIFNEAGVWYVFDPKDDTIWKPFKYGRIRGNHKSDNVVYCRNVEDFCKLLMHWNRQKDWIYYPV